MKTKLIITSLCLFFLVSCDYYASMTGKIIDKETGKPIEGATVNLLDGGDIKITKNDGYFDVFTRPRGSTNPLVIVTKKGYKPFQIEISHSSDKKLYSIKTETKWIDFGERLYLVPNDTNSYFTGFSIEKWSQDFTAGGDTLLIYLSKDDEKVEADKMKKLIIKNREAGLY
jgi:hypothetical protein